MTALCLMTYNVSIAGLRCKESHPGTKGNGSESCHDPDA